VEKPKKKKDVRQKVTYASDDDLEGDPETRNQRRDEARKLL
jgi:hypothetical protein